MPVLALVGNKGGVGKTTLCVNLAATLGTRAPTLVLDADPQESALQWSALAVGTEPAPMVAGAAGTVADAVAAARDAYRYILIDCPPSVHAEQTLQALECADVALIPVLPSPLDIWASVHAEARIEAARDRNPGLRAFLVINQLEPRTRLSNLMCRALAELSLPVARTAIRRRMIYRDAVLAGKTVGTVGRKGAAAAGEIEALANEVLSP
jgi:chromosome partitioning protein